MLVLDGDAEVAAAERDDAAGRAPEPAEPADGNGLVEVQPLDALSDQRVPVRAVATRRGLRADPSPSDTRVYMMKDAAIRMRIETPMRRRTKLSTGLPLHGQTVPAA